MIIYNKIVRDCFFMPKHVGTLDVQQPLTVHIRSNPSNLDRIIIDLYVQCTEQAIIKKVCFKAKGPPFLIAAIEYWCRLVENKALNELIGIKYQLLIKELEIPVEQYPIAVQVEELGKAVLRLMKSQFEERVMSIKIHKSDEKAAPVTFTEAALKHLITYLEKNKEHKGVRLSVKKTGCSGYSYVVDYVTLPLKDDIITPLAKDYEVFIDAVSYPLLKNMQIDYVKQGLNSKFVFNNPNQTGQCGCGESFSVEKG